MTKIVKIAEMIQGSLEIFFRSQMKKQTLPLDSFHEIYLPIKILSNSEKVEIFTFFEATGFQ